MYVFEVVVSELYFLNDMKLCFTSRLLFLCMKITTLLQICGGNKVSPCLPTGHMSRVKHHRDDDVIIRGWGWLSFMLLDAMRQESLTST